MSSSQLSYRSSCARHVFVRTKYIYHTYTENITRNIQNLHNLYEGYAEVENVTSHLVVRVLYEYNAIPLASF